MPKLGNTEIALDGIAYFGIQSPLLKAHNLAHFINQYLEVELSRTIDFESYATGKSVVFPCYISVSEIEQCDYYLIGNKSTSDLFSSYPNVDFWFLMYSETGMKEKRFSEVKEKLYNELCQMENVFEVLQVDLKKLIEDSKKGSKKTVNTKEVEANFKDFEIDFLEFRTQLLQ